MKNILLILFSFLVWNQSFGQKKEEAEKLVEEGIAYHDKGDYEGALKRYNKALDLDKNNLTALCEKALTLFYFQQYDECITVCQKAISTHSGDKNLKTLYVTYGNAFDELKKTDLSIEVYNEGIRKFPNFYQLYFNRGITLYSVNKKEEALKNFQTAIELNPNHASSHNAIARISNINKKKIPAFLAFCRFLSLEPEGNRAKENLNSLKKLLASNVEETGKNTVTIKLNSDLLGDTASDGKPNENNFQTVELMLTLSAAIDLDKKNKKKNEAEVFLNKLETVCSSLQESKKNNYGFFWEYYVPYFLEMKSQNLLPNIFLFGLCQQ